MHFTHREENFVVAERFIRTLKIDIYKHMTAISKNAYSDKLDEIVDKYNNTYHIEIKMKPTNVKVDTCIDYDVQHNNKDPKFKVGDHVRISKYKYRFRRG